MKKVLAAVLAVAMAASMSAVAFAADSIKVEESLIGGASDAHSPDDEILVIGGSNTYDIVLDKVEFPDGNSYSMTADEVGQLIKDGLLSVDVTVTSGKDKLASIPTVKVTDGYAQLKVEFKHTYDVKEVSAKIRVRLTAKKDIKNATESSYSFKIDGKPYYLTKVPDPTSLYDISSYTTTSKDKRKKDFTADQIDIIDGIIDSGAFWEVLNQKIYNEIPRAYKNNDGVPFIDNGTSLQEALGYADIHYNRTIGLTWNDSAAKNLVDSYKIAYTDIDTVEELQKAYRYLAVIEEVVKKSDDASCSATVSNIKAALANVPTINFLTNPAPGSGTSSLPIQLNKGDTVTGGEITFKANYHEITDYGDSMTVTPKEVSDGYVVAKGDELYDNSGDSDKVTIYFGSTGDIAALNFKVSNAQKDLNLFYKTDEIEDVSDAYSDVDFEYLTFYAQNSGANVLTNSGKMTFNAIGGKNTAVYEWNGKTLTELNSK